jgi:hypothetical protein
MLCYSESKTRLDTLKMSYPELFQKRSLYVAGIYLFIYINYFKLNIYLWHLNLILISSTYS